MLSIVMSGPSSKSSMVASKGEVAASFLAGPQEYDHGPGIRVGLELDGVREVPAFWRQGYEVGRVVPYPQQRIIAANADLGVSSQGGRIRGGDHVNHGGWCRPEPLRYSPSRGHDIDDKPSRVAHACDRSGSARLATIPAHTTQVPKQALSLSFNLFSN
jgi:hypothetical protein